MSDFRITTSADLTGLQQLKRLLEDIEQQAKRITREFQQWEPRMSTPSAGGGGFSVGFGSGASQPGSGSGGRRSSEPPAGQRYDLSTVQGLENWEQQVFAPASTVLRSAQRALGGMSSDTIRPTTIPRYTQRTSSGGTTSDDEQSTIQRFMDSLSRKIAPEMSRTMKGPKPITPESLMPKTGFRSKAEPYSDQWYSDFFSHVGRNLNSYPEEIQQAFEEFKNAAIGWEGQPKDPNAEKHFYEAYRDYYTQQANALNQQAQEQFQAQMNPGLASEFGAAIGALGARYLPFLSIGGATMWAAGQIQQGYQMWQQSSAPFDQLAHSIQLAGHDVENFRKQVSYAGAQFGESLQQSAQSATLLTQSFGNLSQNGLAQLVGQTARFALQNGISYQQASQITGTSATLGITSGATAQMSASQFQDMLSNMASQGHMQGRQGEMATAYLDVMSNIGAMNPTIANPQGIAYTLTQMNATGIQALQGMRGAQMYNQFASGMMNPNQTAQAILGAAIYQASGGKINNPLEWMELEQEGPNAKIPGTNITVGQAEENYLNKQFGNNQLAKAAFLQFGMGQATSINNAKALLSVKNLFNGEESTKNNQQDWYSAYDINQREQAKKQVDQSGAGYYASFPATAFNALGFGGSLALAGVGSIAMSRYGRSLLRGISGGEGISGGLKSVGSAIAQDAKRVGSFARGIGSRIGSLGSRIFGGAAAETAAGAAADATAVGGIEAIGAGLDATGIGALIGVPLGIAGLLWGGSKLLGAHPQTDSQHNQVHQSHNDQVRSQARTPQERTSISQMTIDQLRINQLSVTGGGSSILSAANNNGLTYNPTSGDGSGGGFMQTVWRGLQSTWQDVLKFLGFGGNSGGGSSSPAPMSLSGSGPAQQIWNFLASKGLSAGAIAGIMGNLEQESGFSSTARNPSSGAYGIAQWLGSRLTALDQYAAANHLSPSSLQAQLGYLWNEIASGQYVSISKLNSMSPSQAAVYFEEGFEKAGPGADLGNRESYANQIYSQFNHLNRFASGGEVKTKQLAWIAEEGPEFVIPTSSTQRSRALSLYLRAGEALGLTPNTAQSAPSIAPSSQFVQVGSNQVELGSATIAAISRAIGQAVQTAIPSSRGAVRPL